MDLIYKPVRYLGAALLVSVFATATTWAERSGVKMSTDEVKQDTDLNKPGASSKFKPSNHYTRVPVQQGRVQQDSDWNEKQDNQLRKQPLSASPLQPATTKVSTKQHSETRHEDPRK